MDETLNQYYRSLGLSENVYTFCQSVEKDLEPRFKEFDRVAEYNQLKVIKAMQEHKVSDYHFADSTGYGYNDSGRDTLEAVYASVFHTEDALVRPHITCGTHAPDHCPFRKLEARG